jgi:hypothetical protein
MLEITKYIVQHEFQQCLINEIQDIIKYTVPMILLEAQKILFVLRLYNSSKEVVVMVYSLLEKHVNGIDE